MFNPRRRSQRITFFAFLLVTSLLCGIASAAPSITLSKKSGPPTSKILVSGRGFEPNVGVDIFFDTKDKALVVTNGKGEFHDAGIFAPRGAHPGEHWVTALERNNDKGAQEPFLVQTDWAQFRFDAGHTGANPYENILDRKSVAGLSLVWKYATGSWVGSSPSLSDGVIYIAAADGTVLAVTADTGHLLWRQEFLSNTTGLSVINDTVYVGSNGQYFYAINARTGTVRWEYPTGVDQGSPAIADGVAYVGSVATGDTLFALNANTGVPLWSSQTNGGSYSSPAEANGILYIGSFNGNIYAVDSSNGKLLWKYATGNSVYSSPAVADGMVFVGSADNNIYALNASTGTLLWRYATGSSVDSSPAVVDGVVYVGSGDNSLYALKTSTGTLLWKYATGGVIFSSPVVANGVVYVASTDYNIYALSASTGSLLWRYPTDYWVPSSPAVANGMVYVGSDDQNLYAFGLTGEGMKTTTQKPDPRTLRPNFNLKLSKPVATPLGAEL